MSNGLPTKPGTRSAVTTGEPSLSDMELMERFDGECADDGDDGGDGIDRPKFTGLAHVAELVRGHLEMQAEQTPDFSSDLWSKIEARLDGADAVRGSARTAIAVEDRRHDAAGGGGLPNADLAPGGSLSQSWQTASSPGVWGWLAHHRAHFVTGMVSAGVVAAVALWLRPGAGQPPSLSPIATHTPALVVPNPGVALRPQVGTPALGNGSDSAMIPVVFKTPTEVEALDVTDGSGTVMTIADEDGETAVIWISPKDVEGL
ncbi:MAG: hypothetical protein KBG15_07200 [Kofleriaceae bacterium]|nr:hypothetical protein [Kofleriaceae bacterium]